MLDVGEDRVIAQLRLRQLQDLRRAVGKMGHRGIDGPRRGRVWHTSWALAAADATTPLTSTAALNQKLVFINHLSSYYNIARSDQIPKLSRAIRVGHWPGKRSPVPFLGAVIHGTSPENGDNQRNLDDQKDQDKGKNRDGLQRVWRAKD